jgi:iron complex outermembrane receptor protein
MTLPRTLALSAISLAALSSFPALAQSSATNQLDTVVITGQRVREPSFDVPASISAVTRQTIEDAGPGVNVSEALNRVPGIVVLNRNNYAQDVQMSIRGFGSRSTFGIRGVKVLVDGIPASMPDGQGQVSNISLASTGRIEVLRGPLAQLYGNAAGGVVQ